MPYHSTSRIQALAVIAAWSCICGGCQLKSTPQKLAKSARLEVHVVSPSKVPNSRAMVDPGTGATVHLTSPPVITSADVATVQRSDDAREEESFSVYLTPAGAKKLAAATTPAAGQQLAVVVNGKVVAVAKAMAPLSNSFQIAGGSVHKDREQIFNALTRE